MTNEQIRLEKAQKKMVRLSRMLKLMILPIMAIVGIIPLIVRIDKIAYNSNEIYGAIGKTDLFDFFSQYKAMAIMTCTVIMVVALFLIYDKTMLKIDKNAKIYLGCMGIFLSLALISTCLSPYKQLAMWGLYDNAEGFIITLCYAAIVFYTYFLLTNIDGFKYILGALLFLLLISTVLGVFEYKEYNLLINVPFFRDLIIPKPYEMYRESFGLKYTIKNIGLTMYHYDYVGSFAAMMVPLFLLLLMLIRGKKKKCLLLFGTVASVFILLACGSRAGLVGAIGAMIIGVILLGKIIIKKWKITLPIGALLIVGSILVCTLSNLTIIERLPSLGQDILSLFSPSSEETSYKEQLPVQQIDSHEGKVTFTMNDNTITFSLQDGQIVAKDQQEQVVTYNEIQSEDQTYYETGDKRFSEVRYIREEIYVTSEPDAVDSVLIGINRTGAFSFRIKDDELISMNATSGLDEPIIEAPSIGFKGKEKLGSSRGYIWSRTLPVLFKKNLLVGGGAETFITQFPQNDLLAKWYAYNTTEMTITKPHNLYLQIAMNYGCVALIALLIMIGVYLIQSIKLYGMKTYYNKNQAIGLAIMLAIVGYLGAGLFNDSVISVAPIFWVLLGTGMAVNYKNRCNNKLSL